MSEFKTASYFILSNFFKYVAVIFGIEFVDLRLENVTFYFYLMYKKKERKKETKTHININSLHFI